MRFCMKEIIRIVCNVIISNEEIIDVLHHVQLFSSKCVTCIYNCLIFSYITALFLSPLNGI